MFSQVKKNESALEKIKGYQGEIQIHTGKMEVCQIERKNAIEWKPIKFKKQKKLARLKTRKGGLSKLEKKKKKISQGWKPERAV